MCECEKEVVTEREVTRRACDGRGATEGMVNALAGIIGDGGLIGVGNTGEEGTFTAMGGAGLLV